MTENSQTPVRVAIVEDHRVIREVLAEALGALDWILVVGQAATGMQAIELCEAGSYDVVLLDAMLPDMNGLDCVQKIRRGEPNTKFLILTGNTSPVLISRALELGVQGYIEKSLGFDDLVAAVKAIATGRTYYGPTVRQTLQALVKTPTQPSANSRLTGREHSVLAGVAAGKSSKEIAADLGLSFFTVNNHRRRIKNKTGLRSTSDLTLHALSLGLVGDQAMPADLPVDEVVAT